MRDALAAAMRRFDATIHSCSDARRLAQQRLPWMVFDYIDGAAGEGRGQARNREALRDICLQPRVLNNVATRSVAVEVFGKQLGLPFGVSPMGMCNLAGPGADSMLARLAAEHAVPVGVSTCPVPCARVCPAPCAPL